VRGNRGVQYVLGLRRYRAVRVAARPLRPLTRRLRKIFQ
jgi:hypothetical protein